MSNKAKGAQKQGLASLRNVGKAALRDFSLLGISSVDQLAECDPTELYNELSKRTGTWHDPCVWDVFAATIHQAKTGEARNWWEFTEIRKQKTIKHR